MCQKPARRPARPGPGAFRHGPSSRQPFRKKSDVERRQSGTPPPPPRGSLASEFVSFAAAKGVGAVAQRSFGFGLLFPLLNFLFSALNLFRQSFVFFEVEIEDVKFVHKKNSALYSRPEISESTEIFFVQICGLMGVCGYKQIWQRLREFLSTGAVEEESMRNEIEDADEMVSGGSFGERWFLAFVDLDSICVYVWALLSLKKRVSECGEPCRWWFCSESGLAVDASSRNRAKPLLMKDGKCLMYSPQ